jgi:hypothetical protein
MASIPVTIVGSMTYSGLEVGGGPMPGGPPVEIWPSPGHPAHPIVIPPDAIGPGVPTHPIYIPVYPAHPIVIPPGSLAPGVPTHPIVLPPPVPAHPIVIPPDAISPGVPAHPIVLPPPPVISGGPGSLPPWVMPPIYYPPDSGGSPPGIWGGPGSLPPWPMPPIALPPGEIPPPGNGNSPTHPIYLPPDQPPTGEKALVHVYIAGAGGCWFLIDNPSEVRPPPTGEPEPRPRRG